MIPVLGIPHFNRPDLTARCIRSIDFPIDRLVIVDQGTEKCLRGDGSTEVERALHNLITRQREAYSVLGCSLYAVQHRNAGVSGAWNEIIKLFPADYWMIVSNDIEFAPGDLEKMHKAAIGTPGVSALHGNHGFCYFAITAPGVERVGLFDENIFPAYLEDCDWSRRCDLAGGVRINVPDCHARHGDDRFTGSCTIQSDPELHRKNGITHGRNFDYYRRKWGGLNGQEKFDHPFNDPNWPIQHWLFSPPIRAAQTI